MDTLDSVDTSDHGHLGIRCSLFRVSILGARWAFADELRTRAGALRAQRAGPADCSGGLPLEGARVPVRSALRGRSWKASTQLDSWKVGSWHVGSLKVPFDSWSVRCNAFGL